MKIPKKILINLLVMMFAAPAIAIENPFDPEKLLDGLIETRGDEKCADMKIVDMDTCKDILALAGRSVLGDTSAQDELRVVLKKALLKPGTLNSVLAKEYGDDIPLGLEFKSYDSKNGGSVLGLSYAINYNMFNESKDDDTEWNRRYAIDFSAAGNIVNEKARNPRNFLDTKLTIAGSASTKLPRQDLEFGHRLTELGLAEAQCEGPDTEECRKAREEGMSMLDSVLKAFARYEYGLDAGYESDQSFDAGQSKFSLYVFGQYEDWTNRTWFGKLNVTPTLRVGIDSIDPNDETPRAIAGDDSSFARLSSELSLWVPIKNHYDIPVVLTFNHRYYYEIDASDIVENANLDSFNLRTYSLTGSNGLYVSYSSGKLPLDVVTDEVVELGWKTYF